MSKKRMGMHALSMSTLSLPNCIYLALNFDVMKEANAIALSMTAMIVLAIVGLGALTHIKVDKGVWVLMIGVFILALSNISYIAGTALIIEGGAIAVDGYLYKPLIEKIKIGELENAGKTVTYTKQIK